MSREYKFQIEWGYVVLTCFVVVINRTLFEPSSVDVLQFVALMMLFCGKGVSREVEL
tara:strand:- start:1068 stop:1238 length:171 start_codon:yes stop_codon:yes gene_type:complete